MEQPVTETEVTAVADIDEEPMALAETLEFEEPKELMTIEKPVTELQV